ncbi:MAG: Hsp20/alpha crystallin family protein [Tissierellia bacterium]|nr:Hsp20/alpha crystallin family protein [Tissierellia bacterium]
MTNLIPRRSYRLVSPRFNEFNNFIDNFFKDSYSFDNAIQASTFKVDVEDKDDMYVVEAELPGIDKEDIDVQYDEGRLSIMVNHDESKEEEDEERNFIHRERRTSSMSRSMYFENIDEENLEANLENGILTISIPKQVKQETKRKITIN